MNFVHTIFIILLIVCTAPLFIISSILIIVFSGFPILFLQKRVGYRGKIFTMYKFRTMIVGSEKQQSVYHFKNEANGPVFKIYNDPRFTTIGKFLSHTGIDELPQLWNILLGNMALFGPRPLPVKESHKLKSWQKKRYLVKPGIISPWVLSGYHRQTFDEWMRNDCQYVQKKSFLYDLQLFFFFLRVYAKVVVSRSVSRIV